MYPIHHPAKLFLAALSLSLHALPLSAQSSDPAPAPSVSQPHQKVSLGIGVTKPSEAMYAQMPTLPHGSGFLLQSVSPTGAAAKSGLQAMDLIWKLDDQVLINEGQLMVLLSHRQPGDEVKLSYFRSGVGSVANVKLQAGTAPAHPEAMVIAPPVPGFPARPMRVVSYEDRSASISDKTGIATLTYREGKLWLQVESNKGVETFNGTISKPTELARVPSVWRNRLPILRSALDESLRLRRLPRIRRVPTPKVRVAAGE